MVRTALYEAASVMLIGTVRMSPLKSRANGGQAARREEGGVALGLTLPLIISCGSFRLTRDRSK